jgi:6-phosphogluconolactonase
MSRQTLGWAVTPQGATIAERLFAAFDDLVEALSADIAGKLNEAVLLWGSAGLVATGGATPGPVYDALSRMEAPWAQIQVTLSDERWAPPNAAASNERLVRERLLRGPAAAARFTPFKTPAPTPALALADVEHALQAMNPPFDVTLLGMGNDGHVASLFPQAPELAAALDDAAGLRVCAVHRPGAAGAADRMSLTRKGLLDSRAIAVLITGAEKLAVYRRALEGDDIAAMPIRMVLQQRRTPVQVWWAP